MRAAGVGQALVQAAREIVREQGVPQRGATLSELAARSCVGYEAARQLVPKLKSRGHLEIVGHRRVDYRNRPVAEYAPVQQAANDAAEPQPWVCLDSCVAAWAR